MSEKPVYPIIVDRGHMRGPNLSCISPVADDGDDEQPLPPTLAKEAAPFLRQIYKLVNDPKYAGRGKSAEFGVPTHLRAFVTAYLAERKTKIAYTVGQLTGKQYVTVSAVG